MQQPERAVAHQRSVVHVALAMLLASSHAQATSDPFDPSQCDGYSVAEAESCLSALRSRAESLLGARLDAIARGLDAELADAPDRARALAEWRAGLQRAAREWRQFVDADCALTQWEWYRGAGATAARERCHLEHVRHRLRLLDERYGSSGGDD